MVLHLIKEILENRQFEAVLLSPSEQVPIERLMVSLGPDKKNRNRILEIGAVQLEVPPELVHPNAADFPYRLQFRSILPFKVEDLALTQTGSLILFLNRFIDLPAFELDELTGIVSYRYVWMMKRAYCDQTLLLSIVGASMLNLGLFADMIESLADGQRTFNDILSEVLKVAQGSPSEGEGYSESLEKK